MTATAKCDSLFFHIPVTHTASAKNMVNRYSRVSAFFASPAKKWITTYSVIPTDTPASILPVSGISSIVIKAGTASVIFSKSIYLITPIISTPAIISVVAVAADGIADISGEIIIEARNIMPVNTAVRPVLPPSIIPVVLSA